MATKRRESKVAPGWWDFTTLDAETLDAAAALSADDLEGLSRDGFKVRIYESREEFYNAQALEYVEAWLQAAPGRPAGICGPIGPVEQLPLVAQIVNAIGLDLKHAHFWGMDEWVVDGETVPVDHPLSFQRADLELCFNRIRPELRMPKENLHFPGVDVKPYVNSWDRARCVIMQGGQGEVKHWAFNDPPRREGKYADQPPSPAEYRKQGTRLVTLHPLTMIQNARSSGGGRVQDVPSQAMTVGPAETWKAECVSIWQRRIDDNPLGIRLTAYMISKRIPDAAVPMSLLADHHDVRFSYLRSSIGECALKI
ncbi:MAG: glucosamine-6-phosphate isomerase [Planctomycetota bacterium]|jgi:glucosamine-6-phosphate deaminase|nr:glucosamine-6-phosphate isomerase [Planctomycetota bacterium]